MTTFTEGKHAAEFLLYEEGSYSRDQVVLSSTAGALDAGTVLGKVTATGEYVAYDNAAVNGSEVARAILLYPTKDQTVDQKVTVISRTAEVIGSLLTGLDANGTADLAAVGIVVR